MTRKMKRRLPFLAAGLVLVLGLTAFALRFYDGRDPAAETTADSGSSTALQAENPAKFYSLKGKTFASSQDAPFIQSGDSPVFDAFGGVNGMFVLEGTFYVSISTRIMAGGETQETEWYSTLFRYNLKGGSVTAISDELADVTAEGNRFVYAYSAAPGQKNPELSNNAQWNDERPFEQAKSPFGDAAGEAWIDSEYGSAEISLTMKDSGKQHTLRPKIPEASSGDLYAIGVLQNQLYLSAYTDSNENALFAVDLESGSVTPIALEGATDSAGVRRASIGADGFLYTGSGKWLVRVNPADNTVKRLAAAPGKVLEFASNGKYALCMVKSPHLFMPAELVAVRVKK